MTETTRIDNCLEHGSYESTFIELKGIVFGSPMWSGCPKCVEIEAWRMEAEKATRIAQQREQWRMVSLQESGVQPRFYGAEIGTFKADSPGQRAALEFARGYIRDVDQVVKTGRGAMFVGRLGTGKTHLACAIVLAFLDAGKTAFYVRVQDAVRRVKASWGRDAECTEREVMGRMTDPDLLVIDEIGVQFGTDFERNLIFDIIDTRYGNRKPTILLSNLTTKETTAFVGERVIDRMTEDGGMVIPFDWESHRGAK